MSLPPTKIILAADAVAYLPIHALSELKPSENGATWNQQFDIVDDPQADADKSIVSATGDRGCIQRIIAENDRGNLVVGVCDPLQILRSGKEAELCVVGGLINRPCFWVVADNHSGTSISTLDIEEFCQHQPQLLTSTMWSNKLFDQITTRNNKHDDPIRRYVGSFDDVIDGAVFLKENLKTSRIAALTPCVLSVALLQETRGPDWRAFKLFDDVRYRYSTTTAFVVHRDALSDINIDFHERLAYFISQVISMINHWRNNRSEMSAMIQRLCADVHRFKEERQINCASSVAGGSIVSALGSKTVRGVKLPASMPIDASVSNTVSELLIGEDGADIFCSACEIRLEDWNNAISFYGAALSNPPTPLNLVYSDKILKMSHEMVVNRSLFGISATKFNEMRRLNYEREYFASMFLVFPTFVIVLVYLFSAYSWSAHILAISMYVIGLLVIFQKLKIPKKLKWLTRLINSNFVVSASWSFLVFLIIWATSFALRLVYFGAPENNDPLFNEKFGIYKTNYPINYNISSIFGVLDSWKIQRDDIYGIVTVSVSSWITLFLGYEKAKIRLGKWKLALEALPWIQAVRNRLHGGGS